MGQFPIIMTVITQFVLWALCVCFPQPAWSSSLLRDAPIDAPVAYPTVDPTDAPTDTCPDGWFNAANLGCFYFANSKPDRRLTWVEAMDVCDNMGGYLAEIQTQEQADFIASIATVEENLTGVRSWWLGLTDMGHEGRWMWGHSSTDSEFTAWEPSRPNSEPHNHDDCVSISMSDNYLWRDVQCYEKIAAAPICQMDLGLDITTTPATTASGSTTPYSVHVELIDGDGYGTGNVFVVNANSVYGPVCDDDWGDEDATVVCRQLGFSSGTATTETQYFGPVPEPFAMDDVRCSGYEATIQECEYSTSDNCGPGEGAGVICSQ